MDTDNRVVDGEILEMLPTRPFFEARGISKNYEGEPVIRDVDLYINRGEIVSLVGPSGIGKTTLFTVLSGLEKPDGGAVFLAGEDVSAQAGRVGYMLQEDLLLPFKTVEENVAMPLILGGEKRRPAIKKVQPYLEAFGLAGTGGKYPAQLSGGMRQRAAFLRAYLFRSDMMLLDEPFSALDALTKSAMEQWFHRIARETGVTALLITHDIEEAVLLSDRIYLMGGHPGRITAQVDVASAKRGDAAWGKGTATPNRLRERPGSMVAPEGIRERPDGAAVGNPWVWGGMTDALRKIKEDVTEMVMHGV
ncbi:MAG: ABC transporter ATP-binding protein [Lachnospiraceae bacterium]|jgi:ABC-type nitrate/sulfonate/bicarbonate transport system ATPase subunit|nr:ABC transporter ATP-binding protein [Lachnospiraceae bacterium]